MGLLDILNGMQNGPRGPADPQDKSGGMSKFTMAILALLAWKAYKHMTSGQPQAAPANQPRPMPAPPPANAGGGWGDFLKGGLGGLVLGGAAGSVLSGGLGDLLRQLQHNRRCRQLLGWPRPEPADWSQRSRQCARRRPDRRDDAPDRDVTRRAAERPQPLSARRGRSAHAGRPAADRRRGLALDLIGHGGVVVPLVLSGRKGP